MSTRTLKNYSDVAVINANAGTTAALMTLSSGKFKVPADVTNNATNLGWDTATGIKWPNINGYTRTAYAAGTWRKFKFDLTGVTPVAGTTYELTVYRKTKRPLNQDEKFKHTQKVVAATGEGDLSLALKFYNHWLALANENSKIVVSNAPVAGSEYFYVECKFGTLGSSDMDDAGYEASTLFTVTSAATFAAAAGTASIVNEQVSDQAAASATFVTYEINYDLPVKQAPHGLKAMKECVGVVYVISAVDAVWKARLEDIMEGRLLETTPAVVTAITAAADASISSVAHGLSVGDRFFLTSLSTADGDHQDEWQELENTVLVVKAETSADVFTIENDTSGFDAACTGGFIIKGDPYKAK